MFASSLTGRERAIMTGLAIAGALAAELVWFSFVKEMETADRRQRTLVPLRRSVGPFERRSR